MSDLREVAGLVDVLYQVRGRGLVVGAAGGRGGGKQVGGGATRVGHMGHLWGAPGGAQRM